MAATDPGAPAYPRPVAGGGGRLYAGQPQPLDFTQQTDMSRIEAAGRLQFGAQLQPGEYVLQVVVTDPLADESHRVATQWIDFALAQ